MYLYIEPYINRRKTNFLTFRNWGRLGRHSWAVPQHVSAWVNRVRLFNHTLTRGLGGKPQGKECVAT